MGCLLLPNISLDEETITLNITRDQQKHELPGERDADETVEMFRMSERRREIAPELRLHKILGQEHRYSIDAGAEEDPGGDPAPLRGVRWGARRVDWTGGAEHGRLESLFG